MQRSNLRQGSSRQACKQCGNMFEITDDDLKFLESVSPVFNGKKEIIPSPTHCPDCRLQRRLASPNIRNFYKRNCDSCGKQMVSAYSPDKQLVIYCQACWWGDKWDACTYGRDIDFNRPFIEQMKELQRVVPRPTLMNKSPENSEYCNYAGFNKNCYLAVFGSWYNEDCLYGTYYDHSKSSVDCGFLTQGELCYESLFGTKLYQCFYCVDSSDCSDCLFSLNLRGCRNCMFCSNLRNKEYHIDNKQVSPEEFEAVRSSLKQYSNLQALLQRFHEWRVTCMRPATYTINCENCSGDYLRNCKNVHDANMVTNVEDGKYLFCCEYSKDCQDCSMMGYDNAQLFYECVTAGVGGQRNQFCFHNWTCNDMLYCDTPQSSSDCFGCVCVQRKRHCILNKQYTKEEYEALVPKIIDHMRKSGEWGEFFPISYLAFAYNETVAQEYFPLSKETAMQHQWGWQDQKEEIIGVTKTIPADSLPDSIDDIPDDILNWAIICSETGRPFKIVKQELNFYRQSGLPIPRFHHDERHKRRMALHNPLKLWERECMKCGKGIETTYAPERPEIVYCEECYLKAVY